MTALRTLPKTFPQVLEAEAYTHQISRADIIRRLAQCQNYLWANVRRTYANSGYEGNGFELYGDFTSAGGDAPVDPIYEPVIPGGIYGGGFMACSFICPPNWGAGSRLKIQGLTGLTAVVGGSTGRVVACLFELDGSFAHKAVACTDIAGNSMGGATVTTTFSMELVVPNNRPTQVRIYVGGEISFSTSGTYPSITYTSDHHSLAFVSARFATANAGELAGDHVPTDWKPLAHFADVDLPQSAALMRALIRNTNSLWAMRGPEVCQAYLGQHYGEITTYTEVGRYIIYLPPRVTAICGVLKVLSTHGGAGNNVRVLVDGVVKETSPDLTVNDYEVFLDPANFTGLTSGAEHTITIEARSTSSASDFGTMVHGVCFWEEDVDLGLPGGTSVPTDYAPLDESKLRADDLIEADLNGAARTGLLNLLKNDTWLARNRLRGLIGDWRHRLHRRKDGTSLETEWTPGLQNITEHMGRPKNITVISNYTYGDSEHVFTSITDQNQDGLTSYPHGHADAIPGGRTINNTPIDDYTLMYRRSGRRLGWYWISSPAGASLHSSVDGYKIRAWVRALRLRPAAMNETLEQEDPFWANKGVINAFMGNRALVDVMVFPVIAADKQDHLPRWFGPLTFDGTFGGYGAGFMVGGDWTIEGQQPRGQTAGDYGTRWEGNLFEMECRGVLLMDDPLDQVALDALT